MTNFAAVRNLVINRAFVSHFFPISLLLKKSCSSSGPVRFIPGQFSKIKKTQKFTFANYESNHASGSNENSYASGNNENNHASENNESNHTFGSSNLDGSSFQSSHFDDDTYIGGFSRIEKSNDSAREVLDTDYEYENELNTISKPVGDGLEKIREEIEQAAVRLLATRAMTAAELQKKLRGMKYPLHIVESIIVDYKARGLLNDSIYAELFTRSRWLSSTWGPGRISHVLRRKGVSEIETEKARKQVFEDEDDVHRGGGGENVPLGMCKLSMEHLFLQASKQWLKSQNTSVEKQRVRVVRWLLYRGFSWEVINRILKRLESQCPT